MDKKRFWKKGSISFALYIVTLILSQIFMRRSAGVMLTIPLCAILPAVATMFYNNRRLTVVLSALLSLFFNLISTSDFDTAIGFAILSAVFAFAGIFVKRMIVTSSLRVSGKRVIYLVLSAGFAFAIILSYANLFGNPISALEARRTNLDYVKTSYQALEFFENEYTYYNYDSGKYITAVSFLDGKRHIAEISYQNDMVRIDGIREYFKACLMEALRTEIYDTVNIENADLIVFDISDDVEITPVTKAGDVADKATLRVNFESAIDTRVDFSNMCEGFADKLYDAGVTFAEIEFTGGYAEKNLYRLTLEYGYEGELFPVVEEIAD